MILFCVIQFVYLTFIALDNPYVYKIISAQSSERVLFGPKALLMWFTEISRIVVNNKIHCRTSVLSQQTFLVFQDVFSVTLFVFQDLFKTSSRHLQDVFAIRLPKTSSRRLEDVFVRRLAIISWRQLEDVLKTSSVPLHQDECLLGWFQDRSFNWV